MEDLIPYLDLSVSACFSAGIWSLPSSIPPNLDALIYSVPISSNTVVSSWISNGKPSFHTFQKKFFQDLETVQWSNFIWFKHHATRFSIYSWMAFRNGLKTADALISRGISASPECVFCKTDKENLKHLLFECDFSYNILLNTLPQMSYMLFRPNLWKVYNNIEEWEMDSSRKSLCYILLTAIVYFIWKARNDRLFGNIIECQTTVTGNIKRAVLLKILKKKCFQNLHHWLK
ncbi:uncharacterized protein LOC110099279 [Dendrobium catenatum]|uniref:uncharacterized protein LOC110099279 n=1 Tax=Dendrobium catenatum TaxID=906689 RepID=UPI0009F51C75|nr:uncharacterized protein LOC110099279 [Dendrobium catenatum]